MGGLKVWYFLIKQVLWLGNPPSFQELFPNNPTFFFDGSPKHKMCRHGMWLARHQDYCVHRWAPLKLLFSKLLYLCNWILLMYFVFCIFGQYIWSGLPKDNWEISQMLGRGAVMAEMLPLWFSCRSLAHYQ